MDTVERRIVGIIEEQLGSQIDAAFIGAQIMEAVVAPILAVRDHAVEWAEWSEEDLLKARVDLAAARQQLDQVREGRDLEQQALRNAVEILTQIRKLAETAGQVRAVNAATLLDILDAPAGPAGHDESGQ